MYVSANFKLTKQINFLKYESELQPKAVYTWFCKTLYSLSLIQPVKSVESLQNNWYTFESKNYDRRRIVFISKMMIPPLFYSVLSFTYEEVVLFGFLNDRGIDSGRLAKLTPSPAYVFLMPGIRHTYGTGYDEHLTYPSMKRFLRKASSPPSARDLLAVAQVLINFFLLLDFCFLGRNPDESYFDGMWRLGIGLVMVNVYILAFFYFIPDFLIDIMKSVWQTMGCTVVVASFGSDWRWYLSSDNSLITIPTLVVSVVLSYRLVSKFFHTVNEIVELEKKAEELQHTADNEES